MTDTQIPPRQVAPLVFIDTETTGLHLDRRAWEIALIRREPDGTTVAHVLTIRDVDLAAAEPMALKIGDFYCRHPGFGGSLARYLNTGPAGPFADFPDEAGAAVKVEKLTRGAHLVGVNPAFDAETLDRMLRRHRLTPAWHYHLVDLVAMTAGFLNARGDRTVPPWSSDALAAAAGVEAPTDDERHTALGDARWAMRWYDHLVAGAPR